MKTKAIVYGEIVHKWSGYDVNGMADETVIHFEGEPEIQEVLGLLGDEGLEPQVGMKVWDSMFGDGRIIEVNELTFNPYSVLIKFESDKGTFSRTGRWKPHLNRTCYVTSIPEEERGWAVITTYHYYPFISAGLMTRKEAEDKYGDNFIHWIPESEVKK